MPETEEEQGYTPLCRAMPDRDVVVELLHVDLDDYKLANEIVAAAAEVSRVEQVNPGYLPAGPGRPAGARARSPAAR